MKKKTSVDQSIAGWKKEFYPVSAKSVAARGSIRQCIQHALKKWTGTLPENLDRYNLCVYNGQLAVMDELDDPLSERFCFYMDTCAVCYYIGPDKCKLCPLYHAYGGHPCCYGGNPRPMIRLLTKALANIDKWSKRYAGRI